MAALQAAGQPQALAGEGGGDQRQPLDLVQRLRSAVLRQEGGRGAGHVAHRPQAQGHQVLRRLGHHPHRDVDRALHQAPLGTPADVVARINKETADIVANDKETQARPLQVGAIAAYQPSEAMHKRLATDHARCSKVAREKGLGVA